MRYLTYRDKDKFYTNQNVGEIKKIQGHLSTWLAKHGLVHRSLGFDYQGIETLQIKPEDWHSIAVILYVYGYNYLRHSSKSNLPAHSKFDICNFIENQ